MPDKDKMVLCFGEVLLRASPPADGSWLSSNSLPIYLGGAECNVAHALALWNVPVSYLSAMPDNYLSESIKDHMSGKNIDTSRMLLTGDRMGIYFLQQGTDLKHRGVIYDRAHSSFAGLQPGTIDWDGLLEGIDWFHFSAISPALNESAVAVCKEVLEAASKKGITISVDLNYRAKLWQYGKKPDQVMPELTSYAHVVMGNIWAANTLLGVPLRDGLIAKNNSEAYVEHAAETSKAFIDLFPNCQTVANTFRFTETSAKVNYYATLYTSGQNYSSPTWRSDKVVDTVGSGDCFMAGLIYGLRSGNQPQDIINYASAAAFGKLHEVGDTTTQTISDVQHLMKNNVG